MRTFTKGIIITMAIMTMAFAGFAAERKAFPGWGCTDVAKWEEYRAQSNSVTVALMLRQLAQPFNNWQELLDYALEEGHKLGAKDAGIYQMTAGFVLNTRQVQFYEDAAELVKDTSYYIFCIHYFNLNLSNDQKYDALVSKIVVLNDYDNRACQVGVDDLCKVIPLVSYDDAKIASDLKRLNRKLSAYLVGDKKEIYEPIVAKLRTVLATY